MSTLFFAGLAGLLIGAAIAAYAVIKYYIESFLSDIPGNIDRFIEWLIELIRRFFDK